MVEQQKKRPLNRNDWQSGLGRNSFVSKARKRGSCISSRTLHRRPKAAGTPMNSLLSLSSRNLDYQIQEPGASVGPLWIVQGGVPLGCRRLPPFDPHAPVKKTRGPGPQSFAFIECILTCFVSECYRAVPARQKGDAEPAHDCLPNLQDT